MKAYVMIHVRPGSVLEVVRNLKRLKGVVDAQMTFGPYDGGAIGHSSEVTSLGPLIANEVQPIPGVVDTLTCLVVEQQ